MSEYIIGVTVGVVIMYILLWIYGAPQWVTAYEEVNQQRFVEDCMKLDKTRAECERVWKNAEHWVINEQGARRE